MESNILAFGRKRKETRGVPKEKETTGLLVNLDESPSILEDVEQVLRMGGTDGTERAGAKRMSG